MSHQDETKREFNFFMSSVVADQYEKSKQAMAEAERGTKKKIYRDFNKMLQECYFVGSLKYGNNFIA